MERLFRIAGQVREHGLLRQIADQPKPISRSLSGVMVAGPSFPLVCGFQDDSLDEIMKFRRVQKAGQPVDFSGSLCIADVLVVRR